MNRSNLISPSRLGSFSTPAITPAWQTARPASSDRVTRHAVQAAVALSAALSVANFNDGIVPASASNLQQFAVVGLWIAVLGLTFLLRPVAKIAFGTDFYALTLFYAFAALSVAWSSHSSATVMKGIALTITTFAAYRVATHLRLAEFLGAVSAGFIAISAISVGLALFSPNIGVDQTWMHHGQWQGVFQSKQSLGTLGAFLMFFSYHRLRAGGGWGRFLLVFGLAVACVIGSESRGGAAMALAACLSLSLPRRWLGVTKLLAFGPLLMIAVALCAMIYLIASGNPFFPWFGTEVDFTERAIIWQYALSHLSLHPLLGFGLDGFWSIDAVLHAFEREHGWVLDNYHDGYVGIMVETGMLGMLLFAVGVLMFGIKMRWLITHQGMTHADYTVIIGFLNLVFFIDMTETFFLRSTNINSVVLVTLMFMACRAPERRPSAIPSPGPRRRIAV